MKPGPDYERRKLAESSLIAFGYTYFPHICTDELADFQKQDFLPELERHAVEPDMYLVGVLPKEFAKSSWATIILPLFVAATVKSHGKDFIRIWTKGKTEAGDKLGEVLFFVHEPEHPLQQDYALPCQECHNTGVAKAKPCPVCDGTGWYGNELMPLIGYKGRELKFKDNEAVLGNGVKLKSMYFGQPARGMVWRGSRPKLDIFDDPEDETNVKNPQWRKEKKDWYNKQVLGGNADDASLIHLGTIVHYDSILTWLLVPPKGEKESWTRITKYKDCWVKEPDAEGRGGISLWPQRWPPERLIRKKASMGPLPFNAELRNQPTSDETRRFNPEDWGLYLPSDLHNIGGTWTLPHPFNPEMRLPLKVVEAVDPAWGEELNTCYSAYIVLAAMHPPGLAEPYLFLLHAEHLRVGPLQQVSTIQRVYEMWRPSHVGIEAFIAQKILAAYASAKNMPVVELKDPRKSKPERIDASAIPQQQGRVFVPKGNPSVDWFIEEAAMYPSGESVDGLDAFAHAVNMCSAMASGSQLRVAKPKLEVMGYAVGF